MIPLLVAVVLGILYSIGGWKWRQLLRTYTIPILLGIFILSKVGLSIELLYAILIGASFNIGYGNNCPLQKLFNKFGWTDYNKTKWWIRGINAAAIAGSAIVFWRLLVVSNAIFYIPFYTWLTCTNPCKDIKIGKWTIEAARVEEFIVCFAGLLIPLYLV